MINLIALIIFFLPLYLIKLTIFNIPTTILELLIYLVFTIELFLIFFKKKKLNKINLFWLIIIILFILSAVISVLISKNITLSLGVLKAWIIDPIIVFFLIYNNIKEKKEIIFLINSLVFSATLLSIIGLIQYFFGKTITADLRLSSLFNSANYFAIFLGPIIPLVVYLIFYSKNKKLKNLYILIFFIFIISFFLTKSYAGWLALFFSFLVWFFYNIKSKNKYIYLFLIFLIASFFIYNQTQTVKFKELSNFQDRSSIKARLEIWQVSWYLVKNNLIFGIGLGNFQAVYQENLTKVIFPPVDWAVPQPHNLFLAFWLNMGILGLIVFIAIVIKYIKICFLNYKAKNKLFFYLFLSMFFILIHGLFDTPYWKNDFSIEFWFLVAAVVSLERISKKFKCIL